MKNLKNNRTLITIVIIVILTVLFIPIKIIDETSTKYKSVLYSITLYHKTNPSSIKGYDDGVTFKLLGFTIIDKINTYVFAEHVINIKDESKIIEANTGSFCYKSGECIDKVDFQDFTYDIITSYYNKKLYIDNLDGNIKSVEVFDYSSKTFIQTNIEFTDDYIVTPNINGLFIFKINATYEGKNISYYFMSDIK